MSPLIRDGRNNDNIASGTACTRLLLAMAGLPGTGKSTIAAELAKRLHALVLNKDDIRARLFPGEATDYSREQDDLCMEVIFLIAEQVLKTDPERTIIIDGRTFTRSHQVNQLLSRAESSHCRPVIVECICDDAVAEHRLDSARLIGAHPAGNRTYTLYSDLKEKADPIAVEHLIIDTGRERLEACVERCLAYVETTRRFLPS
jgi:adenylylsulfate kinase